MNRYLFLILVVSLFLLPVSAQAEGQDITGWGKLKWGDSVEQAKSLYEIKRCGEDKGPQAVTYCLKMPRKIMGLNFGVLLSFCEKGSTKGFCLARLMPLSETKKLAVNSIIEVLKVKYGAPVHFYRRLGITRWVRKSGKLETSSFPLTTSPSNYCFRITYEAMPKEVWDNL